MGGRIIKCNPPAADWNPRAEKVSPMEKFLMGLNGNGGNNGAGTGRQNGSVHLRLRGGKMLQIGASAHKEMHGELVKYINDCRKKLGIDVPLPTDTEHWKHEGKADAAPAGKKAALAALAELAKCVQGCDYGKAMGLRDELESLLSQAGEKAAKGGRLGWEEMDSAQPGF